MVLDVKKYPFIKSLEEELKKYGGGITLTDLLLSNSIYLELAKDRIQKVRSNEELPSYTIYSEPVLVFYTTLLTLAVINNSEFNKKYSYFESKQFRKILQNENDDNLLEILKFLNIKVNRCNEIKIYVEKKRLIHKEYCINFIDYLKYSKNMGENWRLSKQILVKGNVYLDKNQLIELAAESIRLKILNMIKPLNIKEVPEKLKNLIEKGKTIPPCIQNILSKDNLNEEEIKVLVVFYINIGKNLNNISNILKKWNVPNIVDLYNKYKGDKDTKYIVYSCERMKKLNMCVSNCNVINPLQLYFLKAE